MVSLAPMGTRRNIYTGWKIYTNKQSCDMGLIYYDKYIPGCNNNTIKFSSFSVMLFSTEIFLTHFLFAITWMIYHFNKSLKPKCVLMSLNLGVRNSSHTKISQQMFNLRLQQMSCVWYCEIYGLFEFQLAVFFLPNQKPMILVGHCWLM